MHACRSTLEDPTAGLSSFGFGGTNAHVVLEEAPERPATTVPARPAYVVPLSARSAASLERLLARYEAFLETTTPSLRDLSYTASCGRAHLEHRLALIVEDMDELRAALAALRGGESSWQKAGPRVHQGVTRRGASGPRVTTPSFDATAPPARWREALAEVAAAFVAGRPVDWRALFAGDDARRVALPATPFDRARCWFDAPEPAAAPAPEPAAIAAPARDADAPPAPPSPDVAWLFRTVRWQPTPLPVPGGTPPGKWVVLADDLGIADALGRSLVRAGHVYVPVYAGPGFADRGAAGYVVDPSREDDFAALAEALARAGEPLAGVVHLWGCKEAGESSPDVAQLDRALDTGVFSLFHLTRAMTARFKREAMGWWIVTTCAQAVPGSAQATVAAEQAPLWSLARVIGEEYPRLRCGGIDLDTQGLSRDAVAETILAELTGTRGEKAPWVAYRAGERLVAELDRLDVTAVDCSRVPLRERGVYLISGGQEGLGLAVAQHLARRVHARLVLVNRTPLAERPDRVAAIREIERLGGEVMVETADVADCAAMRRLVTRVIRTWDRLDGVVHAAGVLRDHLLINTSRAAFAEVLRPKIHGTWALHEATRDQPLDFFAVFSSMASILAPAGQGSHVAANAYQDAFVQRRARTRAGRNVVIGWGPWRETGVVSSERYRESLARRGLHGLSTAEGLAAFETALAGGPVHLGVFGTSVEAEAAGAREETAVEPTDIADHLRPVLPGLATTCGLPAFVDLPPAMQQLAASYVAGALGGLGWRPTPGERASADGLIQRLGIQPPFKRLTERMLAMLAAEGALTAVGDGAYQVSALPAADAAARLAGLRAGYPAAEAEFTLLERCGTRLADVLAGRIDPIQVLMPGGRLDHVEALYRDSPFARFFNQLAAAAVREAVARMATRDRIRVLEVGAGTGATSDAILSVLPPDRTTYVFTDVSKLFLRDARPKLERHGCVEYRLLDVERDPAGQGFAADDFDLVIAANVLHATKDLRTSLDHVQRLLRPGGLLLLLEATRATPWLDLIFGLLDGWRKFGDDDLRSESPLLPLHEWERLLGTLGFVRPCGLPAPGDLPADPGQALILARRAGQPVRRDDAPARATPTTPERPAGSAPPARLEIPARPAVSEGAAWDRWVEARIVAQLARSLEVEPEHVSRRRSFIDLGLDSLLAVEIAATLTEEIGVPVSPVDLFEHSTARELARHLAGAAGRPPGATAESSRGPRKDAAAAMHEVPPPERLLALYDTLPSAQRHLVDAATTPAEADRLIVSLAGQG